MWVAGWPIDTNWLYDPEAKIWQRKADATFLSGGWYHGVLACVDSRGAKDLVWIRTNTQLWLWNPETDVYTLRGNNLPYWTSDGYQLALHEKRSWLVGIGGGVMTVYDLWRYKTGMVGELRVPTSGDDRATRQVGVGFVWHPPSGDFIAWTGGPDIRRINDSLTWRTVQPAAENIVDPGLPQPAGTWGRFRYAPGPDLFVVVNSVDRNVFLYRMQP